MRHLRSLLSAPAVALTDTEGLLAWDGQGRPHIAGAASLARTGVADGSTTVHDHERLRLRRSRVHRCARPSSAR